MNIPKIDCLKVCTNINRNDVYIYCLGVSVAEGASAMINVDIFAKHSDVEIILQSFIGYTCVIWEHRPIDAHI